MAFLTATALPPHPMLRRSMCHPARLTPVRPAAPPCATLNLTSNTAIARQILTSLLASNQHFVAGNPPPASQQSPPWYRRHLAENGQKPVAAIVACADSRTAPETLFARGIGEIFVIRNAGNVVWEDGVMGSLEFAVGALGVKLVMVMGHSNCGAVGAAVGGGVPSLKGALRRHIGRLEEVVGVGGGVQEGVVRNVRDGVRRLKDAPEMGDFVRNGDVLVVGAVCDIATGAVTIVDDPHDNC
eukprot:GFKZ01001692.1.p1 GENE.GFKZ01001692.1~~GFKZ01001692.1.p1  ORF type:complete len:249 (-),score=41.02 GFKZ01001692.1:106-831(-)